MISIILLTFCAAVVFLNIYTSRRKKKKEEAELLEYRQMQEKRRAEEKKRAQAFNAELESIPRHEILMNKTAKSHRLSAFDLPEIKYTGVGKAFNSDKLPVFVVIDTETTGLKASSERIIELSAIKYADFEPVEIFTTLINPGREIPAEATKINGITDSMVADAPKYCEIMEDFDTFIGAAPLVGYNLPFDLKFIFASGLDFTQQKRKYFDVLDISRRAFKGETHNYKLSTVAEHLNIYRDNAHHSASDCLATAKVFIAAINRLSDVSHIPQH